MKVIDVIIKLQQLDPNMEAMIDVTQQGSTMFKIVPVNVVEEIGTALNDKFVLISTDEGITQQFED